jgi:hypothetical protein
MRFENLYKVGKGQVTRHVRGAVRMGAKKLPYTKLPSQWLESTSQVKYWIGYYPVFHGLQRSRQTLSPGLFLIRS